MIAKTISAFVFFFACIAAHADGTIVHTNGEPALRAMAQIFFPNRPMIPSAGADGLFVWRKLEDNKNDAAIQAAHAVHFAPLTQQEDHASKNELLATLAHSPQVLMARKDSPINSIADIKKSKTVATVGWIGHACEALVKEPFAKQQIEFIYVPYKTGQQAIMDFLGGRIDYVCPTYASLVQLTESGAGKVILNLTEHHGFQLTTNLYVNKDMPQETKQMLLSQVQRKFTNEELKIAESNGITLNIHAGAKAKEIFDRDRAVWKKILNK
jgi:tripartite-type tricarboxylate transporter receptor subunit TctC